MRNSDRSPGTSPRRRPKRRLRPLRRRTRRSKRARAHHCLRPGTTPRRCPKKCHSSLKRGDSTQVYEAVPPFAEDGTTLRRFPKNCLRSPKAGARRGRRPMTRPRLSKLGTSQGGCPTLRLRPLRRAALTVRRSNTHFLLPSPRTHVRRLRRPNRKLPLVGGGRATSSARGRVHAGGRIGSSRRGG
jgi:hypothetical protein